MIVITEVSKKEMNNVKTLRPARINLDFVGWMRISLTGYIEKYKISRGITKKKYGSYLNDEAVSKMKLYFIFLRKPVRLNPFLIVRLTPKSTLKTQLWTVSPCPSAPRFHKDTSYLVSFFCCSFLKDKSVTEN